MTIQSSEMSNCSELPEQPISQSIDRDLLNKRCMGLLSLTLMLLTEFESEGPKRVGQILSHSSQTEPEAAAEVAHALKGAAAIIGAEPIRNISANIEQAGSIGDIPTIQKCAQMLQFEMQQCLLQIQRIRLDASNG